MGLIPAACKWLLKKGRGGCLVLCKIDFYFDDPSSNPADFLTYFRPLWSHDSYYT